MLTLRKKASARTTNSYHRSYKYNNIIKDLEVNRANQVWVSDITYIRTVKGFCYLALITASFNSSKGELSKLCLKSSNAFLVDF